MEATRALRYVRNPDFVFRRIGGEILLLPIRKNMGDLESIFALNEVGARLWEWLESERSVDDLAASVAGEFEVADSDAMTDVQAFLDSLQAIDAVIAR